MKPTATLALLLVLASCSDTEHSSYSRTQITSTGAAITLNDVTIQVAEDVLYRSSSTHTFTTADGGVDVRSSTLDGHGFGTASGRFRIGSVDYGPVAGGDEVRVSRSEGVFVNDEHRGELPPARDPEPGDAGGESPTHVEITNRPGAE